MLKLLLCNKTNDCSWRRFDNYFLSTMCATCTPTTTRTTFEFTPYTNYFLKKIHFWSFVFNRKISQTWLVQSTICKINPRVLGQFIRWHTSDSLVKKGKQIHSFKFDFLIKISDLQMHSRLVRLDHWKLRILLVMQSQSLLK